MMMLLTTLLAQAGQPLPPEASYRLTLGGAVVMILSVGFVTGFLGWCIYKVIATPGSTEHLHTQADIHTPDEMQD